MSGRVRAVGTVLLFLISGLWGRSSAEGTIFHRVPDEIRAQEPLTLEAVVEAQGASVSSVIVYYRVKGQSAYLEAPMSAGGADLYFGTVPAGDIEPEGLEYYLIALLDDNSILAYPVDDPELNPFFVRVLAPGEDQLQAGEAQAPGSAEPGDFLILSPDANAAYLPEDVVVAISLFNLPELELASIKVILNGRDITAESELNPDLITYSPATLATGPYQLQVQGSSAAGRAYQSVSLPFRVTRVASRTSARAYRHSGSFTPAFRSDNIDGEILQVGSFKASYRGGWEWLRLRGKLKLTTQEDPFKSPRNRFTAHIQTPLLTVGLGDVTPRFGRFGLAGKRLRGYDANFTLGLINLRVAQGELERVIQGRPGAAYDVTDYNVTPGFTDNDPSVYTLGLDRGGYGFRRNISAFRPSLGSGRVFEWAVSLIKAKDDVRSVDSELLDGTIAIADSSIFTNLFFSEFELDTSLAVDARILTFKQLQAVLEANSNLQIDLSDSITMEPLTPSLRAALDLKSDDGVLVNEVLDDSPAKAAGIKAGDVLVEYDGKSVDSPRQLRKLVSRTDPGEKVPLRVIRKGRSRKLSATIGENPRERDFFSFGGGRPHHEFDFDVDIRHEGDVHRFVSSRGQLGVEVTNLNADLAAYFKVEADEGVLVLAVWDESVAAEAGVKAGDVIVKLNAATVSSVGDLREATRDLDDGDDFTLSIVRQGQSETLSARMVEAERGRRFSSRRLLRHLRVPGMYWWQSQDDNLREEMDDLRDELHDLRDQLSRLRGS